MTLPLLGTSEDIGNSGRIVALVHTSELIVEFSALLVAASSTWALVEVEGVVLTIAADALRDEGTVED